MKKVKSDDTSESQPITGLRFRIKNLRTECYKDPLIETDYYGYKVGDLVSIGYASNVIHRIKSIDRDIMNQFSLDFWTRYVAPMPATHKTDPTVKPNIRDKKAYELLEEYKKNGNFGANKITLETLLRGNKEPKRNKISTIWELDHIRIVNYNRILARVDIPNLINNQTSMLNQIDARAKSILNRKAGVLERRTALENLMNFLNPKTVEETVEILRDIDENATTLTVISPKVVESVEPAYPF